jgi:hypothetical protein
VVKRRARLIGGNGTGDGDTVVVGDKYDPSHFLVPAQDHKGHSVREWFRVSPTIDHEIDAVVTSKKFPFRTKGDLIRWGVYEAVKRLEKMEDIPNSMINVAEIIIEQSRHAEMWGKFRSSLDALEHAVKSYVDTGNEAEALKLLSRVRTEVLKIPEDVWREQYVGEMDKRFGHIWKRNKSKAVSLAGG